MDGIQKSVHIGLMALANRVANGEFGCCDDFADEDNQQAFLSAMHDEVIDNME